MRKSKRTMKKRTMNQQRHVAQTEHQPSMLISRKEAMAENERNAVNTKPNRNIPAKRNGSPSSADSRQWESRDSRLEAKQKFCEPLVDEFLTMGPIPRRADLRRRRRSDPADFVPAVERWLEFVAGNDPEGGGFLKLYYDKNGEPTRASGPVWSSMGGDDARREGEELAGALSAVQMKQVRRKERIRYYREILFDALDPVDLDGRRVVATDSLRLIFEEGLSNLPGSADSSESPPPRTPGPSGGPTLLAEAAASPANTGNPTSKTDNNALGQSVGGHDGLDPGALDERAAEEHAGDSHGRVDKAAGHEAEREDDGDDVEGGGHGGDDEHDDHANGEGCVDDQSGPAASGSQLPLRMPSAPTKRHKSSPRRKQPEV